MDLIVRIIAFIAFLLIVSPIFTKWFNKKYNNSDFLILFGAFLLIVIIYYFKRR